MTLCDRSRDLLASFDQDQLHATHLKQDLAHRATIVNNDHNLTSHTVSSAESTVSFAYLNPNDLSRLSGDVEQYKTYLSQVKFSWLESNVKRRFVQHVLADDSNAVITAQHNVEFERQRAANKATLKALKVYANQSRTTLKDSATALDQELSQLLPQMDQVQALARSIRSAEIDLAALKSEGLNGEQMTVEEANELLEDQDNQLMSLTTNVTTARDQLQAEQQLLNQLKAEVEALGVERISAEKAAAVARSNSTDVDGKLTSSLDSVLRATEIYSSLLGIQSISAATATQVQIVYNQPTPLTLCMNFAPATGAFVNAELLNSAERIDDLVQDAQRTNSVQNLVRQVNLRQWAKFKGSA